MTERKYEIRKAKAADAFHLLRMMKDFLKETDERYPAVEDMDFLKWCLPLIEMGSVWVAVADRQIVGSLGCGINRFDWNKSAAYISNEWLYVKPAYRKGYDIGKRLLEEGKAIADQTGIPFVFGQNSGIPHVERFVQRNGFKHMGSINTYWAENQDGKE